MTRLVEANWKAIAELKFAPLRTSERASATAAYEQDEEAAPRPVAVATLRGRSSGSSRAMVDLRTSASMIADSVKPRISDQVICQVIEPAMPSACSRPCHGWSIRLSSVGARTGWLIPR